MQKPELIFNPKLTLENVNKFLEEFKNIWLQKRENPVFEYWAKIIPSLEIEKRQFISLRLFADYVTFFDENGSCEKESRQLDYFSYLHSTDNFLDIFKERELAKKLWEGIGKICE